ncbi:bifunctional glutamate N-acetyltransferase/amino-acid acetyltransferase ArgJ [Jannaschia seohaensis]|uniref:Arginine biosynthesis bifunctional protein ArgJ n=1 Tax=Jannaschia seohaensis TaxID=475081 RepID=A0A2Y9BW38_9RHOB|nr:bifunctional glutamate N-acetyltransferase/amino-acid acetyltransferase ArgJ [Jannaschia seohaensis]PWJ22134.1 glutamate N-acetyltransferase/amino-acid N-acetyltransferase [Jannaschia seohaensis]SSA38412.1 glutamate N-acetyltransferase / amino-acid N-acetyltransferase [Jannaschia seohaensis]
MGKGKDVKTAVKKAKKKAAKRLDAALAEAKAKQAELEARVAELEAAPEAALPTAVGGPLVSPLAPDFPDLPQIVGVRFATAQAGVKYKGRTDVMLADLAPGTAVAGVFTRSATRSAAVLDCQEKLKGERGEGGWAILVNSGNANAFTGGQGADSVEAVCQAASQALGVPPARVLTSSTGVIGQPLPHDRIVAALDGLSQSLAPDGIAEAARAIMTTDTFPKGATATVEIEGTPVTIAGIAKGSGMIAPDMATMLAYVFTDANVSDRALQAMLSDLTKTTFNAITVDSDTSTSDTVIVAATGRAQHARIDSARTVSGRDFKAALGAVLKDLALQIVMDGEGATKLVEVAVTGAASAQDARRVASAIANSPLVKTAIAGEDPNWGRIVAAVGKAGAKADRDLLRISFGDILVAEQGRIADSYTEEAGAAYMTRDRIKITVDLGLGDATDTMWTCDLTARYIEINADYRS